MLSVHRTDKGVRTATTTHHVGISDMTSISSLWGGVADHAFLATYSCPAYCLITLHCYTGAAAAPAAEDASPGVPLVMHSIAGLAAHLIQGGTSTRVQIARCLQEALLHEGTPEGSSCGWPADGAEVAAVQPSKSCRRAVASYSRACQKLPCEPRRRSVVRLACSRCQTHAMVPCQQAEAPLTLLVQTPGAAHSATHRQLLCYFQHNSKRADARIGRTAAFGL